MKKAIPRYVVRSKKEMAALRAAARQEIVDVLAQMGTVSVAEIATALGRPADALYFHLRALVRAGLVREAGWRVGGRRKEALFCTVAPELRLHYDPQDSANRRAVTAIVSSMLRLGMRDFTRAFERGDALVSGPGRELWAIRKTARLTPAGVARINRSIEKLTGNLSPQRGGRLYGVTILLTPLDHRERKARPSRSRGGTK